MFIEDLVEEYPEEIDALGIQTDVAYSICEVEELADRCESYRERKELLQRIESLESRVEKLESEKNGEDNQ